MICRLLPFQRRAREKFLSRRNFVRPGKYPGFLRIAAGVVAFGAIALLAACNSSRVGGGFGSGFGSPEFGEWMGSLQHFLKIGGLLPGGK